MSRSARIGGSVPDLLRIEARLDELLADWRPLRTLGRPTGRRARMLLHTLAPCVPGELKPVVQACSALARVPWIRAPDTWDGDSVQSLARHLLVRVRHPLPPWLLPVVAWGCPKATTLLARLGGGGGLRGPGVPEVLTRRMLHELTVLSAASTFMGAVRTAQVQALGGGPVLVEALLGTRLRESVVDERWWQAVVAWTCRVGVPDDPDALGPLYDYLDTLRELGRDPPMRQSLRRILGESERWHQQVSAHIQHVAGARLPRPAFRPAWILAGGHRWHIRPMRTVFELYLEGRVLHHCVATYANKALAGTSSLWTMRRDGRRRVTLEVSPEGRLLEARGRGNRGLDGLEWSVVQSWILEAGLTL